MDDVELFQLNKSFSVDELCSMGTFFNHLVYETVLAAPDRKYHCFGLFSSSVFVDPILITNVSEILSPIALAWMTI